MCFAAAVAYSSTTFAFSRLVAVRAMLEAALSPTLVEGLSGAATGLWLNRISLDETIPC